MLWNKTIYNNLTLSCYSWAGEQDAVHRHSKTRCTCVPRTKATKSLALSFLFLPYTNTHTHTHTHLSDGLLKPLPNWLHNTLYKLYIATIIPYTHYTLHQRFFVVQVCTRCSTRYAKLIHNNYTYLIQFVNWRADWPKLLWRYSTGFKHPIQHISMVHLQYNHSKNCRDTSSYHSSKNWYTCIAIP